MAYRLSQTAEQDVFNVYLQGVGQFGFAQAEEYYAGLEKLFTLLARFPLLARERPDIDPPVRVHPYRAHVVLYEIEGRDVVILRVRHGREDWAGRTS